jgi:hypothetical protein
MLGLSTPNYGRAVREFTEAYRLEKSAVSEHFIEASRRKLKELAERRLDKMQFCALLVDATPFEGQQTVVAMGIGQDGKKQFSAFDREQQRMPPWSASCLAIWWSVV